MRFFRDASIRFKVLIPPAVLILALGLVSLLALYGLNVQHAALITIDEIALGKITLIDEFVVLSEQVQSDVFHISVLHFMDLPEEEIQPIHERLEQGVNDLNVIYGEVVTRWPLDEVERSILEQMKDAMDAFRQQALQATAVVAENPSFGVLLVRSSTVPFAEFRDTLTELRDYQHTKIIRIETTSHLRARTVSTTIIGVAFLIALAGIAATVQISSRWISRPVLSMAALMRRLAEGDLTIDVPDLERRDEIGAMARALEVFRNNAIEKARAEEALRESEERFRLAFENANIGVCLVDLDGRLTRVNDQMCEIFGYSKEELESMTVNDIARPEDLDISPRFIRRAASGEIEHTQFEKRYFHKRGHTVWGQVSSSLVRDYRGALLYFISHVQDITERKRAEEQIKASLREKEVLLQEIHHRVKNNLAIVSSLLEWQSEMIEDERARAAFQDSQSRVRAMARIHEHLYLSKDLARVDMAEYIEGLVDYLRQSYGTYAIILKIEAADVALAIDTALPCGLIINELVANAMKHAFPAGQPGEIHIGLRSDGGQVELTVGDNGVGLPADVDLEDPKSLGLTLVNLLAQQLGGALEVDRDEGATFRLTFAAPEGRS